MTQPTSSNSASFYSIFHLALPYLTPPLAASIAIVPTFSDMIAKSAMQKGQPAPLMSFNFFIQGLKGGAGAAPTVGGIVGTQMILQNRVEKTLFKTFPDLFLENSNTGKIGLTLSSSAIVGAISSPFLAIYNGKTMLPPWSVKESLTKFSVKQAGAITLQETGFVAGLATADLLSIPLKQQFGDSKSVEYLAAAVAGAVGSLIGHPGNTALTRWQNDMAVDHLRQLSYGSLRKARGNALFAIVYKLSKEVLNSTMVTDHS
jgi:hypothetical protein